MRRSVFLLLVYLAARSVAAEQVTTTPLQFYGLGTLTCAAWSPDGTQIVTGGSAGALLWDVAKSGVVPPHSILWCKRRCCPDKRHP